MSLPGGATESTAYFDHDDILKKWGFVDNICHYCGVKNSDLNGLLMQCGKCKKAYYCGMKCFNADLPRHQQFCGTKAIQSEPSRSEFTIPSPKMKVIAKDMSDVKCKIETPDLEKPLRKEKSFKGMNTPKKQKSFKKEKVKREKSSSSNEERVDATDAKEKKDKKGKKKKKDKDKEKKRSKNKKQIDSEEIVQPQGEGLTQSDKVGVDTIGSQNPDDEENLSNEKILSDEEYSSEEEWVESYVETTVEVQRRVDQRKLRNSGGDSSDDQNSYDGVPYDDDFDDDAEDDNERNYGIRCHEGAVPVSKQYERENVQLRHAELSTTTIKPCELTPVELRPTPARVTQPLSHTELERVDLNIAEIQKRDYEWEQPDWINPSLRPTEIGEQLKMVGQIGGDMPFLSPGVRAKHEWHKPEWAQKNVLKSTGKGEMLKQGFDALRTPLRVSGTTGTKILTLSPESRALLDFELDEAEQLEKSYVWEKPVWATDNVLRKTGILDQIVQSFKSSQLSSPSDRTADNQN